MTYVGSRNGRTLFHGGILQHRKRPHARLNPRSERGPRLLSFHRAAHHLEAKGAVSGPRAPAGGKRRTCHCVAKEPREGLAWALLDGEPDWYFLSVSTWARSSPRGWGGRVLWLSAISAPSRAARKLALFAVGASAVGGGHEERVAVNSQH